MGKNSCNIERIIKSKEYREALGLPDEIVEEYSFLAQGEYNINYVFHHPTTGEKLVLRINCGSQLKLKHQILYEANALRLLEASGRTPCLYYADDSRKYSEYGFLVMNYLPGNYPDPDNMTDMSAALKCIADIHCLHIDPDETVKGDPQEVPSDTVKLISPSASLGSVLDECEAMFAVYNDYKQSSDAVRNTVRKLLDRGHCILAENEKIMQYIPHYCVINTDANSDNFLIQKESGMITGTYLVDWEKPLYADPAHDIGHMLAPTTTFWKSDVIYSDDQIEYLIDEYTAAVGDRYDTCGLRNRIHRFIDMTCLRGITWRAMAWVQYRDGSKLITNSDTRTKIEAYLTDEFLEAVSVRLNA